MVAIESKTRAVDFIICVAVVMGLSSEPSPSPATPGIACSTWTPNSVQNVTVDGFARFGPAEGCGVELINVSVTFFALPQSTIVLDGWSMRAGGYVAIQGPPNAPWSINDVAVIVTNSVIEALGGPAVSVVLGAGYSGASSIASGGVVLRNVSLYCSGSQLWSRSMNGQTASARASASVLSVTLASTLDAFAPNITIDHFTVVAIDSDLRGEVTATASATAAVASVAAAQHSGRGGDYYPTWMTVSNSVLYTLRCNATAVVLCGAPAAGDLPAEAAAVSAVAGFAVGKLLSVGLTVTSTATAVVHSDVMSTVTVGSSANAFAASTVAGIAVGQALSHSPVTIGNSTTFHVGWTNATSTSTSTSTNAFAGSSVAGVTVGWVYSECPVTVVNSTIFSVGWSNTTSTSTSNSTSTDSNAFVGSGVAGVAVGQVDSNSPVTIASSTTFYVGWSSATSTSTSNSTNAFAGSSVAGVAVGLTQTHSPVAIANSTTFHVGWSNATSTSTNAMAGSSIAGIAVGLAQSHSPVTVGNSTIFSVEWSNTASRSCTTNALAGSSVAGVALGQAQTSSSVTIANGTTFFLGWSNATSGSTSISANALAGSSVAGVAVGQAVSQSPVMIADGTMFYVGWSNATSNSTSISAKTDTVAGSSVAGVAVGQAHTSSPLTIANSTTFCVGWSNAASSAHTTSATTSYSYAGSSVAGVAAGQAYSSSAVTIANTTFYVGWSDASSRCANAFSGSSVAGVAVGQPQLNSPVTITDSATFYVGWSNATSTSISYFNAHAYAGSSVAGVAAGRVYPDCPVTITDNVAFYVGWTNATSTSNSNSEAYAYAGSSVAGVAPASTMLSLALNVTSASTAVVCATGLTNAAVSCMMVPQASPSTQPLCCTTSTAPNAAFSLHQPRMPDGVAGGDWALDPPPQVTWPAAPGGRFERHAITTTTRVRASSPSSSASVSPGSSSLTLRRSTSDRRGFDPTAGPRPVPNSSANGHRNGTPTPRVTTSLPPASMQSPNPVPHGDNQDLGLGLDPTVVTAVVATGYGSTAIAAALSPTSGNKASATSRLVSGAECTVFGERDLSSFPQPDDWSLIPGFLVSSVNLGSDADDSGATAAASKVLTTVVFMVMVWATNAVWLASRGLMSDSSL